MTTCIKIRDTFELSLGKINYDGNETLYIPSIEQTADLRRVFTCHNYSPIVWEKNHRAGINFLRANGFCPDLDHGLTIEQAREKLKRLNLNYALITSRSHTPEAHRFHVLIPFNRRVLSLTDYKRIVDKLTSDHFPTSDPKVKDGARQLYASPEDAYFEAYWTGNDYDVDERTDPGKTLAVTDSWTEKLWVKDKKGLLIRASAISAKTPIHCPVHQDNSPSAFIEYSNSSGNYFIHCSSCNKTYWMEKPHIPIEERCSRFYSYGTDVCEVNITGEEFSIDKIGAKKFYVFSGAEDKRAKKEHFDFLVKEKHISHLKRIDHIADMEADKSYLEYLPGEGTFVIHYAALPERLKDNPFIESWLQDTFGVYKEFIKEWLAVYCYTNYRKLPTLVLKGDRVTGKNTFAEAVLSLFPSISQFWHGEERGFTPEVQKKLLIADESVSANEKQYRILKQRSGQKMSVVNQKFLPEYQVLNNMNIIIMSNEHTPIFVQKDEEPTSVKNNQFFVYTMPRLKGEIDPDFGKKIEERMGHYIRTELRDVYMRTQSYTGCRYSIPTPITGDEKALFNLNMTGLEAEGMKFLQKMVESSSKSFSVFFEEGLFPSSFIDAYFIGKGYTKNGIIRNLKEKGYLEPTDPVRKMVGGERQYCYKMTDKLKTWYEEQKIAQ